MNKSESIVKLTVALLKAQKAMGGATKDAKNPFFKSNYADYGSVLEVVKGPLNDHGIVVLQPHTQDPNTGSYVETVLIHADSGEYISSSTPVICAKQNDPQAMGSAITYARRYGLQSLLSIPSEDDDANSATTFKGNPVAVMQKTATVQTPQTTTVNLVQATDTPVSTTPSKGSFRKLGGTQSMQMGTVPTNDLDI